MIEPDELQNILATPHLIELLAVLHATPHFQQWIQDKPQFLETLQATQAMLANACQVSEDREDFNPGAIHIYNFLESIDRHFTSKKSGKIDFASDIPTEFINFLISALQPLIPLVHAWEEVATSEEIRRMDAVSFDTGPPSNQKEYASTTDIASNYSDSSTEELNDLDDTFQDQPPITTFSAAQAAELFSRSPFSFEAIREEEKNKKIQAINIQRAVELLQKPGIAHFICAYTEEDSFCHHWLEQHDRDAAIFNTISHLKTVRDFKEKLDHLIQQNPQLEDTLIYFVGELSKKTQKCMVDQNNLYELLFPIDPLFVQFLAHNLGQLIPLGDEWDIERLRQPAAQKMQPIINVTLRPTPEEIRESLAYVLKNDGQLQNLLQLIQKIEYGIMTHEGKLVFTGELKFENPIKAVLIETKQDEAPIKVALVDMSVQQSATFLLRPVTPPPCKFFASYDYTEFLPQSKDSPNEPASPTQFQLRPRSEENLATLHTVEKEALAKTTDAFRTMQTGWRRRLYEGDFNVPRKEVFIYLEQDKKITKTIITLKELSNIAKQLGKKSIPMNFQNLQKHFEEIKFSKYLEVSKQAAKQAALTALRKIAAKQAREQMQNCSPSAATSEANETGAASPSPQNFCTLFN